ncbi:MAG: hypothetical protein ACXIUM_14590 [Wenzhouxiangella sp.]
MSKAAAIQGDNPRIAAFCADLDFASGQSLGQSNQGEVRRFRGPDYDLAIKTPSGSGPLRWLRRRSLLREYQIYRRLAGLAGFAACHGLFSGRFLVLDYIEGTEFRDGRTADSEAFFAELLHIIQAMHARGVAHGDLKRKDNLRIDARDRPVILDLGTAVLLHENAGWAHRRLFEFARQTDLNAWVKLKYGGYAGVSPEDQGYLKRSRLEVSLSWLRGRLGA